jgi:hypothetical protein
MKKLNSQQRRAFMNAVLFYTIGWEMREADFLVLETLIGAATTAEDPTVEEYMKAIAEYAWDHLAGEPDDWSAENIISHAQLLVEAINA